MLTCTVLVFHKSWQDIKKYLRYLLCVISFFWQKGGLTTLRWHLQAQMKVQTMFGALGFSDSWTFNWHWSCSTGCYCNHEALGLWLVSVQFEIHQPTETQQAPSSQFSVWNTLNKDSSALTPSSWKKMGSTNVSKSVQFHKFFILTLAKTF